MLALYTAASGMAAQELAVQVISNNIANLSTTGYKRQRAEFQDLLYDHVRQVGTQTCGSGTGPSTSTVAPRARRASTVRPSAASQAGSYEMKPKSPA